jgi:hypothetical protein
MAALFEVLIETTEANLALILLGVILFQVLLVLCILWLSSRIASTTPAQALDIAKESQQQAHAAKAKIDSLDTYIRESFSKDFNGAMQSFDQTTSAVLHQMKDELIRGVQGIEKIESAVGKKSQLQSVLEESSAGVKQLIDAPDVQLAEEVSVASDGQRKESAGQS